MTLGFTDNFLTRDSYDSPYTLLFQVFQFLKRARHYHLIFRRGCGKLIQWVSFNHLVKSCENETTTLFPINVKSLNISISGTGFVCA